MHAPTLQVQIPAYAEFVKLVHDADPEAQHRLPLVDEVAPTLYGDRPLAAESRALAADRVERWRYQILNKRAPHLTRTEQELVDVLDVAARVVRLGTPIPPRCPRTAIQSAGRFCEPSAVDQRDVCGALDPSVSLETVTCSAAELTWRHFAGGSAAEADSQPATTAQPGRQLRWQMKLYAPLYLSSFCVNHCLYCAFRYPNTMDRRHLTLDEALEEAEVLGRRGFRHVLLVAGDFPRLTSAGYFVQIIRELAQRGFSVAVEVAPQSTLAYAKMHEAGACGVTLYQETYQEADYARFHPRGTKVWFDWRLEGPERAAEAGMRRIGLGILLGLGDPATELIALVEHARYLERRFPDIQLAFSLPRIREAPDGFEPACHVDDELFIRLYCSLRIAFPKADLVLSTREPPSLRDRLAAVCITQMSAGSCTVPGGYGLQEHAWSCDGQFPVHDERSPAEVAGLLAREGFDVRWSFTGDRPRCPTAT